MKTREHDGAGGGRRSPVRPWLLLLLPTVLALACGEPGRRVDNQRPSIELTGGPASGDRVPYLVTFHWRGWDQDGVIDHYQVALDLPDSLITPAVEGVEDPRIAWMDTTATSVTIVLSTPWPDSTALAGWVLLVRSADPAGIYHGEHTIYVRAVDNEGGISRAASVTFTATNVSPSSRIDFSCLASRAPNYSADVGARLEARLFGRDSDSPEAGLLPASYEYKLIPGVSSFTGDAQYAVTVSPGPAYPWNPLPAGADTVHLTMNPPENYLLAVRAVDVAGAREDQFELGRNAVLLASSADRGLPVVTVTDAALGRFSFPADEGAAEFEVPLGYCPQLEFSASTEGSCAAIAGYDWGLDVTDSRAEGPGSGFHGWTTTPVTDPICFGAAGTHTLTIRVRDDLGQLTIGAIVFRVTALSRDRDVLYVDDYLLSGYGAVTDEMMDTRARAMLVGAGYEESEIYQIDTYGAGDLDYMPTPLKLSDLARYRLVVWSNWGEGYGGRSALVNATACPGEEVLRSYLEAGGAAWIYGSQVYGAFNKRGAGSDCIATQGYNESTGLTFTAGSFVTDLLQVTGGDFRDVALTFGTNGMVRGDPTVEARAELFPPVEVDSTLFNPTAPPVLWHVDAMFLPTFSAGLDTLYSMAAASASSSFRGKPVALRYLDPDPASTQGPVAIFSFPFHQLKQGSAAARTGVQGMARSMIEWFRSHGG